MFRKHLERGLFGLTLLSFCAAVGAQDANPSEDDERTELPRIWELSNAEIARELVNPVTPYPRVPTSLSYYPYQGSLPGADDGSQWSLEIEFIYPWMFDNGRMLEFSFKVPTYSDPWLWELDPSDPLWQQDRSYADWLLRQSPQVVGADAAFEDGHDFMGDVQFDVAYGGMNDSGFMVLVGLVTQWPTATDVSASRDQTLLGPQLLLGQQQDWGIFGARLRHYESVAGDDAFDTRETFADLFFAWDFGNAWQIVSNPSILYDWEGDSGNQWLVPLGGGVSKTTRIGSVPLKLDAEVYYYVETAERLGVDWMLTFRITPAFSNPLW
jgi:hypothetical protein